MTQPPMTFGSLFAGIGGFDLGFERAGMECKWQVEIDPFCQKVLAKHWPSVKRYDDVRTVGKHNLEWVDVLCGGFPCQDISNAGKRAGIDGERSGLWSEFNRIICEIRPRYVVVENVAALLIRGMGRVLGDLAACGYDTEWDCFQAYAFGAPHVRSRIFILAHREQNDGGFRASRTYQDRDGTLECQISRWEAMPMDIADGFEMERLGGTGGHWGDKPSMDRLVHGIPHRLDRCAALGNAVVPQIAEWVGRRIVESG